MSSFAEPASLSERARGRMKGEQQGSQKRQTKVFFLVMLLKPNNRRPESDVLILKGAHSDTRELFQEPFEALRVMERVRGNFSAT